MMLHFVQDGSGVEEVLCRVVDWLTIGLCVTPLKINHRGARGVALVFDGIGFTYVKRPEL